MNYKKIEEQHIYTITPPKGEKGRWSTYIKQPDGSRKYIAKTKKDDLYKVLEKHYKDMESHANLTLNAFYKTWISYKSTKSNSAESVRRNHQHYLKYLAQDEFSNIPMSKITRLDIENYIHRTIKEFDLSTKELNNMLIIPKGCFELAYDLNLITTNPYQNIRINKRLCRHINKKPNYTQIFFDDEISKLFKALDDELIETPDCASCLAIKLLFETALRVSEVVSLRHSDIEDGYLHVQRMEAKQSIFNPDDITFHKTHYDIVEHVKTKNNAGSRYIPLTPNAIKIIEQAKQIHCPLGNNNNDYIFCDNEGRITVRKVAYRLKKCCRKAGIPNKPSHCIRRTVASKLSTSINLDQLRIYLGHTNEITTSKYIYNVYSNEYTKNLFINALNK